MLLFFVPLAFVQNGATAEWRVEKLRITSPQNPMVRTELGYSLIQGRRTH